MALSLQRSLLSLNPCFLSCKHNIAFLVPKSTALHCILQQYSNKAHGASADSAAGLVGSWGYVRLAGIGTACHVAVFNQDCRLRVTSTHGNGKVLPITSISQQFALQLNWCLSILENFQLENFSRLGKVSAEWGNRNCSYSCWDFAVYQGKGGEGNVEGKLGLIYTPWRR